MDKFENGTSLASSQILTAIVSTVVWDQFDFSNSSREAFKPTLDIKLANYSSKQMGSNSVSSGHFSTLSFSGKHTSLDNPLGSVPNNVSNVDEHDMSEFTYISLVVIFYGAAIIALLVSLCCRYGLNTKGKQVDYYEEYLKHKQIVHRMNILHRLRRIRLLRDAPSVDMIPVKRI